jgi:tyrosyl-DNA phosphodiesterase-1
MTAQEDNRPAKRRKLDESLAEQAVAVAPTEHSLMGLERGISPPILRRYHLVAEAQQDTTRERADIVEEDCKTHLSSPFQLTHIRDIAPSQNVDAVQLENILGNPMIKECWNFNFLFDIDFVM